MFGLNLLNKQTNAPQPKESRVLAEAAAHTVNEIEENYRADFLNQIAKTIHRESGQATVKQLHILAHSNEEIAKSLKDFDKPLNYVFANYYDNLPPSKFSLHPEKTTRGELRQALANYDETPNSANFVPTYKHPQSLEHLLMPIGIVMRDLKEQGSAMYRMIKDSFMQHLGNYGDEIKNRIHNAVENYNEYSCNLRDPANERKFPLSRLAKAVVYFLDGFKKEPRLD